MKCEIGLKKLVPCSIDLTITSPPYDKLREYKGYEVNFKDIISELYRVTKKGGVVVWVVGDQTLIGESGSSFKQALYFMNAGFHLYDTMIFKKKNPPPLSHQRYQQCFEYMFVFSKDVPKAFNPIKVPCSTAGNYQSKNKYRHSSRDTLSLLHKEGTTSEFKTRNNVWEYSVGGKKDNRIINRINPAPFPISLVVDHIISWSNKDDVILDPFMGSGTTPIIAYLLDRQFIAFEISDVYHNQARKELLRIQKKITSDKQLQNFVDLIRRYDRDRILLD